MPLVGRVIGIFIAPSAGAPMQGVSKVDAIAGAGLKGDRYSSGAGSYNQGAQGRRQVTLINGQFFENGVYELEESRRNIITIGVELMWLIGREFRIGEAQMRGVKYCAPCRRPDVLADAAMPAGVLKIRMPFQEIFFDRGGLVAEVIKSGEIWVGCEVIPPPKGY